MLPTRRLFGLLEVPSKVYPYALVVLIQLLFPDVSFLGHLSGVLAGHLVSLRTFEFSRPLLQVIACA